MDEDATAELTGGEISGNSAATSGGAVYAVEGAIITMKNGEGATTGVTINGNTAKTAGAGIFLAQGSTLYLEGNPSFGGTGRNGEGADADIITEITEETEGGKTVILGNFLEGNLGDKTNGQKTYKKFRQDIYAAGYMGMVGTDDPKPATSIVLTGDITSGAGSIWVAMEKPDTDTDPKEENNHYEMLKQFAVVKAGTKVKEDTMQAFRNAWDDESTGCGADYLTGQGGDALSDGKDTWQCVYWTGGFDFVFRKINGYGEPLDVATFKLYTSVKHAGKLVPAKKDAKDTPAEKENLEDSVLAEGWNAYNEWNAYQQPDKETKVKGDAEGISETIESVTVKAYKEDGKPVDSVVTGDGLVEFDKIPPGNYFMVETTEPEHWERMVDVYRVYVDGTGWVSISAVDTDAEGKLLWPDATDDPTAPATEPTVTFVKDGATDKYILPEEAPAEGADTIKIFNILNVSSLSRKVILKKVDIADNMPLQGAKFTVYCYDGSTVMRVKTTDDSGKPTFETLKDLESDAAGAFWIGWLPYGIYYMEETVTPEGYKQPEKRVRLKVDADGVTILDEETAPPEREEGGE